MKRTKDSLELSLPRDDFCLACAEFWGFRNESNETPPPGSCQAGELGVVLCNAKHWRLGLGAAGHEGW